MDKINNTGGLWRNNYKKAGDKRPDYIGEITIDGVTHKIAAWNASGGGGKPIVSLRVTQPVAAPSATVKAVEFDPLNPPDEDIPF